MAIIFQDTFTDTAATFLTSHTPDVDVAGTGWTNDSGSLWRIDSTGLLCTVGAGQNNANIITDCGVADQLIVRATLATPYSSSTSTNRDMGVCFRWVDGLNFRRAGVNTVANVVRICDLVAGTVTVRASTSYTASAGDLLEVTLTGDDITADIGSGPTTVTWNTATGNTSTKHGLTGRDTLARWDDFEIETASTGVTGDLSETLGAVTLSAAGVALIQADLDETLGGVALSAAGAVAITGDLDATIDAVDLNASGTVGGGLPTIVGSLDKVIGPVTAGSSGKVTVWPVIFRDDFYSEHPRWDWGYGQGGGFNDLVLILPTWHHGRMAIGATPSGYADGNIHEASVSHSSTNRYVTFRIQPWDLGPGTQGWGMWNANDVSPSAIWFWWADSQSAAPLQGLRMMVTNGGSVLFNQAVDIPGFDMLAWHEYQVERLPGGAKFYIDGNLEGEYTGTMPTGNMRIEAWLDNAYYPDGVTRNYTPITSYQYIYLDWVEYGEVVEVITGDLSKTIDPIDLLVEGSLLISGDLDRDLGDTLLSATGEVSISGGLDLTLGEATVTSTGGVAVSGDLSSTLDPASLSASSSSGMSGTLSIILEEFQSSGAGSVSITGDLGALLEPTTLTASSESINIGSLSAPVDPIQLDSTGTSSISGDLTGLLAPVDLGSIGGVGITGDLPQTLESVTLSGLGGPSLSGSLNETLEEWTLGGVGEVRISGSFSRGLQDSFLVGEGDLVVSGDGSNSLDEIILVSSGISLIQGSLIKSVTPIDLVASGFRGGPRSIGWDLGPRDPGWEVQERSTGWGLGLRRTQWTVERRSNDN